MLVYLCWVMALGSVVTTGITLVVRDAAARMTWDQAVTLLILPGLVALVLGVGDLPLQAPAPVSREEGAAAQPSTPIVTAKSSRRPQSRERARRRSQAHCVRRNESPHHLRPTMTGSRPSSPRGGGEAVCRRARDDAGGVPAARRGRRRHVAWRPDRLRGDVAGQPTAVVSGGARRRTRVSWVGPPSPAGRRR
jgi:hypothetical protein